MVETQITEMQVTPHVGTSATSGTTDLVYTLRLSPKKIEDTEVGPLSCYPKISRCRGLFCMLCCTFAPESAHLVCALRLSPKKIEDTEVGS